MANDKNQSSINWLKITQEGAIYLGFGLFYVFFSKLLLAPSFLISDFWQIIASHTFFLLLFFTVYLVADKLVGNFSRQAIIYFLSGIAGLYFNRFVIGEQETNFFASLYIFAFWSGLAVFPRVVSRANHGIEFELSSYVWLIVISCSFVSLGGLAYFFLRTAIAWKFLMMLLFMSCHIVYWRDFLASHKEEMELAERMAAKNAIIEETIIVEDEKDKDEQRSA